MQKSKIITTLILLIILTVVMGIKDLEAQTPQACPLTPHTTGWLTMPSSSNALITGSNPAALAQENDLIYNAGLLGTVENFQGDVVAGLDWLYDDREPNLETNMVGTQLVSWWTQKDGRNTILQTTNTETADFIIGETQGTVGFPFGTVKVHVQILGEDCIEIINFCDDYTPGDVVIYDFNNIVSNTGQNVSSGGLQGREGIVTVTPVETCDIGEPLFTAVSWNYLAGTVRIVNTAENWEYGTNVRARTATPPGPYTNNDLDSDDPVVRNFVYNFYDEIGVGPAGKLFKDFNTIGENAGSDLVLMSFGDYGLCGNSSNNVSICALDGVATQAADAGGTFGTPGVYQPGPAPTSTFGPFGIYDANEVPESCPAITGCFLRIGIDEGIPSTDDIEPTPPVPTCPFIDGAPDCSDPLCKTSEAGCENTDIEGQEGFCSDGIDNDGVDGTDCADFGCDGSIGMSETGAICQTGAETTCDDGFDNDANGFVDCGVIDSEPDPNCVAIGACDEPDDGGSGGDGGCTVAAGPVTSGSSAANFLLPLLPLAGVFAARRIIRRRRK